MRFRLEVSSVLKILQQNILIYTNDDKEVSLASVFESIREKYEGKAVDPSSKKASQEAPHPSVLFWDSADPDTPLRVQKDPGSYITGPFPSPEKLPLRNTEPQCASSARKQDSLHHWAADHPPGI